MNHSDIWIPVMDCWPIQGVLCLSAGVSWDRPSVSRWMFPLLLHGIGAIVVSIAAFQAVDLGSIPSQCILYQMSLPRSESYQVTGLSGAFIEPFSHSWARKSASPSDPPFPLSVVFYWWVKCCFGSWVAAHQLHSASGRSAPPKELFCVCFPSQTLSTGKPDQLPFYFLCYWIDDIFLLFGFCTWLSI